MIARRESILKTIQQQKSVSTEFLSRQFQVTEETIRKDLIDLHSKGYIIRTLGGAVIKEDYDPPFHQRSAANLTLKRAIVKQALTYISENDCIALDAGSTNVELAKLITAELKVVVLTNSLEIINILSSIDEIKVISTGGVLNSKFRSFGGRLVNICIDQYNIQKVFLSSNAVSLREGVMDSNDANVVIKRKLVESAKEKYLLVDHTKFTRIAHETVCPIDKINRIITDSGTDREKLREISSAGVDIDIKL